MSFPPISDEVRLGRLQPPTGKIRVVLDTDTYNEIDDQFAVVYALLAKERIDLQAIYAAPFFNNRSSDPGDGMERSYEEILRLLERMSVSPDGLVHKGSRSYLPDKNTGCESEAVRDLIARAMEPSDSPLYVVAVAAITNVASALLLEPAIAERIVVVWLGGHSLNWHHTNEFNLRQDVPAAQVLFDCGVPLVHVGCEGVTSHLQTTIPEMEYYLRGRGAIGEYLLEIFKAYCPPERSLGWSKVIWDIAPIGWLLDPGWVPTEIVHSPILTNGGTWSVDRRRHFIRSASLVIRDPIFADFFRRLNAFTGYQQP